MGHEVVVLTTEKTRHSSDTPMDINNIKVVEVAVPIWGSYTRRKNSQSDSLKSVNADTKIRPNQIKLRIKNFLKKIIQKTGIFNNCRFPDFHDLWSIKAISAVETQVWDLVVSTGGPYSTHRVGLYLKKQKLAKKWVLDWRDLWVDNHIFSGLPLFKFYERHLERRFHELADLITTVSEPLADLIASKTNTPVTVIYNGFDSEDYDTLSKEPFFPDDRKIRIVYTGTIYPSKHDLTPLFSALQALKFGGNLTESDLQVVFAGSNVASVRNIAQEYRVEDLCCFSGFLARNDALRMQRDCDVLLFLGFESPGMDGILTGKLFEYLFAARPIMAVGVTEENSAGALILKSGRGVALGGDSGRIAEYLGSLLVKGKSSFFQSGNADETIKIFEREKQAETMLRLAFASAECGSRIS